MLVVILKRGISGHITATKNKKTWKVKYRKKGIIHSGVLKSRQIRSGWLQIDTPYIGIVARFDQAEFRMSRMEYSILTAILVMDTLVYLMEVIRLDL